MTEGRLSPEKWCKTIYAPPKAEVGWRIENILGSLDLRYFSYGRYALIEALRIAGVGKGDTVLLPGLICREVLSSVSALGAMPSFYPVGHGLDLALSPAALPHSKSIVAVNYFGFSQDLAPFREYCRRTGAVLIEDNAHGLFSRDETGQLLGTRGDLGIFSLRKTVPMPNGAVLVVNARGKGFVLNPQEAFDVGQEPLSFRAKQVIRRLGSVCGYKTIYRLLSLVRRIRRFWTGSYFTTSDPLAETMLPLPTAPCHLLCRPIESGSPIGETTRRRAIYEWIHWLLVKADLQFKPIFPMLPDHTVPYGYPFYAPESEASKIGTILHRHGVVCFRWPDLPRAVEDKSPEHYKQLWVVQFLW